MRRPQTIFLILLMTVCIVSVVGAASPGTNPVLPAAGILTVAPAATVPPAETAIAPQTVVTVIRYISLPQDLMDSKLLFTLQVPAEWNVSTYRMTNSDTSDYRTELVAGNVFFISSYPSTRSREQEYRDTFRQWSPAPVETTETINAIRYDRFESSAGDNTTVAYLVNTNSANERGYASVLVFTTRDSNRFEREDFEKVVSSFRYFSVRSAGTQTGVEIPHYDLSGKAVSGKAGTGGIPITGSTDWDTSGSGSSGSASSAGSSSDGGSSHSSGCHRG